MCKFLGKISSFDIVLVLIRVWVVFFKKCNKSQSYNGMYSVKSANLKCVLVLLVFFPLKTHLLAVTLLPFLLLKFWNIKGLPIIFIVVTEKRNNLSVLKRNLKKYFY